MYNIYNLSLSLFLHIYVYTYHMIYANRLQSEGRSSLGAQPHGTPWDACRAMALRGMPLHAMPCDSLPCYRQGHGLCRMADVV